MRGVLATVFGLLLGWALVAAGPGVADHGGTHTITVQVTGQGTVTDDEGEISCPTDCTGTYDESTSFVRLSAAPAPGYRLDAWMNCPTEDGDACDVELDADSYVIGARFVTEVTPPPPPAPPPTATQRTLTVRVVGPGTVQSDPAGIACGNDCVENFPTNALVVVTAVPADGATFTGWSGDCVGTGVSCAITMSTARSLTATFRLPPPALRLTAPGAAITNGNGDEVRAAGSDVLLYANGRASVVLDGSDAGLATASEAVDAVAFLSDGSLLVSTVGAASVRADYRTTTAGRGATLAARGEDVLRFRFTRSGETTHGSWSMYLDGSDLGLTAASENIDALATATGQLLVSTSGAVSVKGAAGLGEDVLRLRPTRFGETSRGAWGVYVDGSDVGLSGLAENVVGLDVSGAALTLITSGAFSATGVSGDAGDLIRATCSRLGAATACRFVTLVTASDLDLGGSRPGSIDLR